MTTLSIDHSVSDAENIRAFVTDYLEHPSRTPALGVPKATASPVTLKVAVRGVEGVDTFAGLLNHGWSMAHKLVRAVIDDGRVDVRHVIVDVGLRIEPTDGLPVVELLPWVGA